MYIDCLVLSYIIRKFNEKWQNKFAHHIDYIVKSSRHNVIEISYLYEFPIPSTSQICLSFSMLFSFSIFSALLKLKLFYADFITTSVSFSALRDLFDYWLCTKVFSSFFCHTQKIKPFIFNQCLKAKEFSWNFSRVFKQTSKIH
jgi:hypothetical protein